MRVHHSVTSGAWAFMMSPAVGSMRAWYLGRTPDGLIFQCTANYGPNANGAVAAKAAPPSNDGSGLHSAAKSANNKHPVHRRHGPKRGLRDLDARIWTQGQTEPASTEPSGPVQEHDPPQLRPRSNCTSHSTTPSQSEATTHRDADHAHTTLHHIPPAQLWTNTIASRCQIRPHLILHRILPTQPWSVQLQADTEVAPARS